MIAISCTNMRRGKMNNRRYSVFNVYKRMQQIPVEDANFSTILQAFIKCRLIRKISRQLNLPSLIGYFFHLLVHWLVPKLYLINWVHVGIKRTMIGKLLVLSLPDLGSFTCALCSTSFARKHAARRIYTALLQRIFYATWSRSNPSLFKSEKKKTSKNNSKSLSSFKVPS